MGRKGFFRVPVKGEPRVGSERPSDLIQKGGLILITGGEKNARDCREKKKKPKRERA